MSNSQNTPSGSNEAPKTPAPGVAAPAPQQNQGDKPASPTRSKSKLPEFLIYGGPAGCRAFLLVDRLRRPAPPYVRLTRALSE
jgi:hypothetical protein